MSRSIIHRPALAGFLLATGVCTIAGADPVTSFSGITSWVGTGSNSAALVIDWDNGSGAADTSLVWGYHWDGIENGEQMLAAVVAADPHLYALLDSYDSFVLGLGYNQDPSSDFVLTPSPSTQEYPWSFDADRIANDDDDPYYGAGVDDYRTATGAGQLWEEGLNYKYWSYWLSADDSGTLSGWNYSDFGMNDTADNPLQNGQWQGFSFDPNEDWTTDPNYGGAIAPADPVAAVVPEPAAISLILLGSLCVLNRPRRRAAAR
jgi:hypothetical protein